MPTIRYYNSSAKPVEVTRLDNYGVVEIVLDDGRTAQVVFGETGELHIRAWGNIPGKLGNSDQTSFRAIVNFEPQTHCPKCYNTLDQTKKYCCGCKS